MRVIYGGAFGLAGAALVALAAAMPSRAQDLRDLDAEASDVRVYTGAVTDGPVRFSYTLEPGKAVVIDVIPAPGSDFDPTLTVSDATTGEVLVEDDDGGEGLASRARLHSPEGRRLEIEVAPFTFASGEVAGGRFELRLSARDYVPAPVREIAYGERLEGELASGEQHLFTIAGQGGRLLQVSLSTHDDSGLDPMLSLYRGTEAAGEPVASDDDGGGSLNALLRTVLPEDGPYTIAASAFEGSAGPYALQVGPAQEPLVQAPEQEIGFGDALSGRLGTGYENGGIDPAAITYRLTPEAVAAIRSGSGRVTFNMTAIAGEGVFAAAADPFLELGFDTPLGFAPAQSDDDGGAMLDARIAVDLSAIAQGEWLERLRLRATVLGAGGDYAIEMVEGLQAVEDEDQAGAGTDHDDPADHWDDVGADPVQDDPLVPTEVAPAPPIRATD